MKETISVVIPTLNEEQNIESCIMCLVNQIEKPFEIIVVDNGSTDRTRDIVKSIKDRFTNRLMIKLFYYPHGNQTNARDFGIRKSRGTIIGSLDAEACPNKDWTMKIVKHFRSSDVVGIGGKSFFRNRGIILNFIYGLSYYARLVSYRYCIGGGNSAFRKSAFISVRGYEGLDELRKKENITYAKDDYYLSKKLEIIGKLKFCSDLNVSLLYRLRDKKTRTYRNGYSILDVFYRIYLEIAYDSRITRHFKKIKFMDNTAAST